MSRLLPPSYCADHSKFSQGLSFIDDYLGQLRNETVIHPVNIFCASGSVRILLKLIFRTYYAFQGYFHIFIAGKPIL